MKQLLFLVALGGAGLMLTPANASAQFGRPFGINYQNRTVVTGFGYPSFAPPRFVTNTRLQFSTPLMNTPLTFSRTWVTTRRPQAYQGLISVASIYGQGGSYITPSANTRSDILVGQQRNLELARRDLDSVKAELSNQWKYEKGNDEPLPELSPLPDPLHIALAPTDPAMITSGEVLNVLLMEIVRVEAKGANGPSAYISPRLMDEFRFGGAPTGDLLNLARQAGNLDFPSAFDDPALAPLRVDLEKDFAAVGVLVQAGKGSEPDKLMKLEITFRKVQDAAGAVIKNLPIADAIPARRFLNQMANAIKALKANAATGLIDPKWNAEGLTVADLVKHMTRHKLQFAAAPRGGEEGYTTMHRNLATYLFVLNQSVKK